MTGGGETEAGELRITCPPTTAELDFINRGNNHRGPDGRLLDVDRRVDASGLVDQNKLVNPENAITTFTYRSRDPHLTLTEQLHYALAFREYPSDFAKIAELLPSRTKEECLSQYHIYKSDGRYKYDSRNTRYGRLQHFVLNGVLYSPTQRELELSSLPEWDIRLRDRARLEAEDAAMIGDEEQYYNNGRPKRRKTGSMPNYGPTDHDLLRVIPLDMHIEELKLQLPRTAAKPFEKGRPSSRRMRVTVPAPLNLELLSDNFLHPFHLTDSELMHWLRSDKVLPLVKEWFDTVVYNEELFPQLEHLLLETSHSLRDQSPQIADIALLARVHQLQTPPDLRINYQDVLVVTAQFAWRIQKANREDFSNLCRPYGYSERDGCFDGAFVLLFALQDYMENQVDGFFAVLLESELALMIKPAVRPAWERLYAFEGEDTEGDDVVDSSEDEEQGIDLVLPTRKKREFEQIFEYEGEDGVPEDWDDVVEVKQRKLTRLDSGLDEDMML